MADFLIFNAFHDLVRRQETELLYLSVNSRATVGEIARLATHIATQATHLPIERGALIGLVSPNGPSFAAGFLGLRQAGFKVLLFDITTPHAERQRIHQALGSAAELLVLNGWPRSLDDFSLSLIPDCDPIELPSETCIVRLSSGSTGLPRGIPLTASALLADDRALRLSMTLKSETALAAIPLSHAYGFSSLFLPSITCGWPLAVPDNSGPFSNLETIRTCEVTFLPTVPAYLRALVNMKHPPLLPPRVRHIITAGALLKSETAERFLHIYGRYAHVFYGASEVGGICYDRNGEAALNGSVGTPIDGVQVSLATHQGLDSGTGVVEVESPAVALGTMSARFLNLFRDSRFRSSDIGTFDVDGNLHLLGRIDNMANVRGKKVFPNEVERVIESLNGIVEAVVFAPETDNGMQDHLIAVIASRTEEPSTMEILQWCRNHLAPHKVPRTIRRVTTIPRTSRGKINWIELTRLAGQSDTR